jgi:hypothetical protein
MKRKLRLFTIHQTATSLQRANNLNPTTMVISNPTWIKLDEIHLYIAIHLGKNPPLQNGCRFVFKSTGFRSSTFQFNRTFHNTNQPPLHEIPVLPGHCSHRQKYLTNRPPTTTICCLNIARMTRYINAYTKIEWTEWHGPKLVPYGEHPPIEWPPDVHPHFNPIPLM